MKAYNLDKRHEQVFWNLTCDLRQGMNCRVAESLFFRVRISTFVPPMGRTAAFRDLINGYLAAYEL